MINESNVRSRKEPPKPPLPPVALPPGLAQSGESLPSGDERTASLPPTPKAVKTAGIFELPPGISKEGARGALHVHVDEKYRVVTISDIGKERWDYRLIFDRQTARVAFDFDPNKGVLTVVSSDKAKKNGDVETSVVEVRYDKTTWAPNEIRAIHDYTVGQDGQIKNKRAPTDVYPPSTNSELISEYNKNKAEIVALEDGKVFESKADTVWLKSELGHIYCKKKDAQAWMRVDSEKTFLLDQNLRAWRPMTISDFLSSLW